MRYPKLVGLIVLVYLVVFQFGLLEDDPVAQSGFMNPGETVAGPSDECFHVDPRFEGTEFDCVRPASSEELFFARCARDGCPQLKVVGEPLPDSRSIPAFGREIDCMTGPDGSGLGAVTGQDSAVIVPFGDEVRFFFGDTTRVGLPMIPNSMGVTVDSDASDGLDFSSYYGGDIASPALPRIEGEVTVWITDAFVLGNDILSYYVSMPPNFREVGRLGSGTAVMVDGEPPFERTDFFAGDEDDPLFALGCGHTTLHEGYSYQFGRRPGESSVHLKRIPIDLIEDTSAYEFWAGADWSSQMDDLAPVMSNAAPPTVRWSEYHGEYLALYSVMFSPSGMLSEVGYRTSANLTGPWSEEILVRAELSDGGYGTSYQAHWDPVFSRENGRIIYYTATKWGIYNVFLHEIQFDHASTSFSPLSTSDDAYERVHRDPNRSAKTRARNKRLRLSREGRTIVGLRLVGSSFYPATDVESAVLTLALRRPARRDAVIEILVEIGVPNEDGFDSKSRSELRDRPRLASALTTVPITAGETELRIEGSELANVLAAAIAHPDWEPGFENAILLYLTRTDSERARVDLTSVSKSEGALLSLCVGACE